MNVNDAALEGLDEFTFQYSHETGQRDEIYLGLLQCRGVSAFRLLIELGSKFSRRNVTRRDVEFPCPFENTGVCHIT